jgi:hypothetical protein
MSLPSYSRERVEELRSRISLLECSLDRLRQDSWTIFDAFFTADRTPPYIFPFSTFERLGSRIDDLKTISEHTNPDSIPDSVYRCFLIDVETNRILSELVKLQNVMAQRICSSGTMKLLEYQETLQIEYGTITKAYNAVDALSFELVERILGSEWIIKNSYTPISLFDSRGYAVNIYSNIVSVPYYDSFRARFWPALAHEIAHMLTNILAQQRGVFRRTMLDGISRLLEILDYRFDDPDGREVASLQVTELTCDAVAAYSCPASVLSASAILSFPFEEENADGALKEAFRELGHPPSDARIMLMKKVLEETGVLKADNDMVNLLNSVTTFFARKNFALLSTSSHEFIMEYNEFAEIYARKIIDLLPGIGVRLFNGDQWNFLCDVFRNPRGIQLSPVQLICMDWIKRMSITRSDGYLGIREFFNKRRTETKIYEQIVNSMYDYYENRIVRNIEEVRPYDLCVNIS